jgi:pullulanase/glycogen debranching enzyme
LKANYRYINEKKNEPTIYGWQFDPLGYIAIKEEYDKEQYEKLRTNQLRTA